MTSNWIGKSCGSWPEKPQGYDCGYNVKTDACIWSRCKLHPDNRTTLRKVMEDQILPVMPDDIINAARNTTLRSAFTRQYTHEQYDKLISRTIAEITKLSTVKGGEYAGDDDRLANFRRNATALGLSMEQVWAVYAAKHWDSLMQFVKDLGAGKVRERSEPLSGRADDLIVYLILLKAMLEERGQA